MPYRLSAGISLRRFDDCGIVLDTTADRYWQLGNRLATALDWVAGNIVTVVSDDDCRRLASLGLVTLERRIASVARAPDLPSPREGLEDGEPFGKYRLRPLFAVRVCWCAVRSWFAVRHRPLTQILAAVEARRLRPRNASASVDLSAMARDFRAYRRLLPLRSVCLADSLAFLEVASHYGYYPRLVFAVTTHPFAAHCWVQNGTRVLNDHLDHATLFSPILVV